MRRGIKTASGRLRFREHRVACGSSELSSAWATVVQVYVTRQPRPANIQLAFVQCQTSANRVLLLPSSADVGERTYAYVHMRPPAVIVTASELFSTTLGSEWTRKYIGSLALHTEAEAATVQPRIHIDATTCMPVFFHRIAHPAQIYPYASIIQHRVADAHPRPHS